MTVRFDESTHTYLLDGVRVPSITQVLRDKGLIDGQYHSQVAADRGTQVHALTAAYDLGGLDLQDAKADPCYGWLVGWVALSKILGPVWHVIEEPRIHPTLKFGGRPDRVGLIRNLPAIVEIKSTSNGGGAQPWHAIQTAMQAILVSDTIPPERYTRFAAYLRPDGKFTLDRHANLADFVAARKLLDSR